MPSSVKFIPMLYHILQNNNNNSIFWSKSGKSFIVIRTSELQEILKENFSSDRFDSFFRQLLFYGFKMRKNKQNKKEYSHQYFFKDGQQYLFRIQRKQKQEYNNQIYQQTFYEQAEELSRQLKQLQHNQVIICKELSISSKMLILITKNINQQAGFWIEFWSDKVQEKTKKLRKLLFQLILGHNPETASEFLELFREEFPDQLTPLSNYYQSPLQWKDYLQALFNFL